MASARPIRAVPGCGLTRGRAVSPAFATDGTYIALLPVPEALTCRRLSTRRLHDPRSYVAGEAQAADWPRNAVIPLTYYPVPDIA